MSRTQKVLSVQSYRCERSSRILIKDQTGIQQDHSRPSGVNKERQSLKYVLYNTCKSIQKYSALAGS